MSALRCTWSIQMIKLSARLDAVARFASGGKRIVDVGTDHGFIPVDMAQRGGWERIAATDINKAPLAAAARSAAAYGVSDQIELYRTDGLTGCGSDFDTVVIAGMGGDTIINILSASPWSTAGPRLVLQPQTKLDRLCAFLGERGCETDDAVLALEDGKLYVILSAHGGGPPRVCDEQELVWSHLLKNRDRLLPRYIESLAAKYVRMLDGLDRAAEPDRELISFASGRLEDIRKMREETLKW